MVLFVARQNDLMVNTFFERREQQFGHKLQTLFRRHKKEAVVAIRSYARFVKSFSKVRVIAVIHNRYMRNLKQTVMARLGRLLVGRAGKGQSQKEVQELKVQLQDMTVQLENKNESIQRLEDELQQIKVEQSNISISHNLTYGDGGDRSRRGGSFKSTSLKKLVKGDGDNRSNNDSNDNLLHDLSIGSLLGNLNRSRYGSSKFEASCDCTCGLKTKYLKYKHLNESLKNQLEIVKEELEVAKDLNEHFTNEIKQYLTEGEEGDY
jgi:vacuolar-type H+-ATPase subunit D/Vma8